MHTSDHHRTIVKLGGMDDLLQYGDKVGKYGWASEDPPPKALGDMEPGWVFGVEVAMSRQLFPALVLPSRIWHLALLHAWQMAMGTTQNEYPAKPSLQQTHPLLQPDPFSSPAFAPLLSSGTRPRTGCRWHVCVRCDCGVT